MEENKNLENNPGAESQDNQAGIQTVEINGEQLPIEEVKLGYMRQKDYTQKTTAVAQQRKQIEQDQESLQMANAIKELGFSTKEEVENYVATTLQTKQEEAKLEQIVNSNPELAKYKEAISIIRKESNEPVEDIIEKYGFGEKNKLREAALNRGHPGGNPTQLNEGQKSISSMSDQEYEAWREAQGIGRGSTF